MAALIIGTLLALGALAYVLYPLFVEPATPGVRTRPPRAPNPAEAPKLSSGGVAPPAGTASVSTSVADDLVEAAIRSARGSVPACPECGPRPELDAVYCSTCSRYLAERCPGCGNQVREAGARYCSSCGETLAS